MRVGGIHHGARTSSAVTTSSMVGISRRFGRNKEYPSLLHSSRSLKGTIFLGCNSMRVVRQFKDVSEEPTSYCSFPAKQYGEHQRTFRRNKKDPSVLHSFRSLKGTIFAGAGCNSVSVVQLFKDVSEEPRSYCSFTTVSYSEECDFLLVKQCSLIFHRRFENMQTILVFGIISYSAG